jgi:hypothetical protein
MSADNDNAGNVIDLDAYRPPTHYTITVTHYHGGMVEVGVEGVDCDDPRSADIVRRTFAQACSDWLTPGDVFALMAEMIEDGARAQCEKHGPDWEPTIDDLSDDPEFIALCFAHHQFEKYMERANGAPAD